MTHSIELATRRGRRVGRLNEVATTKNHQGVLPVSPATIWRWVKAGKFPAPFKLGPNVTVFDLDEIDDFMAQRAEGAAT